MTLVHFIYFIAEYFQRENFLNISTKNIILNIPCFVFILNSRWLSSKKYFRNVCNSEFPIFSLPKISCCKINHVSYVARYVYTFVCVYACMLTYAHEHIFAYLIL